MVSRIEVIPSEVRGYGNIVMAKSLEDFVPVESELSYSEDVYTLTALSGIFISLTASSTSINVGSNLTLSATVMDDDTPVSGVSVSFYDGTTSLGTGTTNSSGVATYTTSSLSAGSHSLSAEYDDSTSNVVTVTVSDVPTPTPASVSLTSDKSILSYADSESATLSATVLDTSSNPMSGVTVEFFNGSTSMGTAQTDNSGVATKSYASSGVGDVSFSAEVGSLVSETYSISDIYKYISGTNPSEISNNITSYSLSPRTSVNPTFSSDGTNIILTSPDSTNSWQRGDLSFLNDLNNFKISITTSPNRVSLELNNNNKLYIFMGGSFADTYVNSNTWSNPSIGTLDSSKEYIYEMIVNGTNINLKVYETDRTVIINTSKTISASMNRFGLAWTKNNTFRFKDLKVELL